MVIKIGNLRQESDGDIVNLSAQISSNDGNRDMVFRRYSNVAGLVEAEPRPDAFLMMILLHAMKTGQNIWIEDPVDPLLLFELRGDVQNLLKLTFSELVRIKIEAEAREPHEIIQPLEHVATGFSGGVDSMQLIHRKQNDESLPNDYQVTMLMHHDVGSVTQRDQYLVNLEHSKQFANDFGLAFAGASCETTPYYKGFSFLETHCLRTTAATLSLWPLFRRYLFASGTDMQAGLPSLPTRVLDAANPMLLPLLKTKENDFKEYGSGFCRLEKMLEVLANDSLRSQINVCARVSHDNSVRLNCGRCFKCFPFLLVAEAVGRLDQLDRNFDLHSYQHHKPRCFANFFTLALGPKKSQTNRQVARFLRIHAKSVFPISIRALLRVVPDPISDFEVDELLEAFGSK